MRVEIVRELDETLAQIAASLDLSKEETARILLESALVMESSRS
jgi:hypothetical protein